MENKAGAMRVSRHANPDPGKPAIAAPPLACDCHLHIVGPADHYPLIAERSYTPVEASIGEYQRVASALGLGRAVIVQPSFYGVDNRCTHDALAQSGGKWHGIAVIGADTTRQEVQRLHDAGFRGVRATAWHKGGVSLQDMGGVAKLIAPFGWHMQVLVEGHQLEDVIPVLRKLPLPVVIDHMGRVPAHCGLAHPGFQALLSFVREGNCWVKLSGAYFASDKTFPYEDVIPFAQALVEAGPERTVWGSDWPHTTARGEMPVDAGLLDILSMWAPDPEIRHRILVENPAKLYDFPSSS